MDLIYPNATINFHQFVSSTNLANNAQFNPDGSLTHLGSGVYKIDDYSAWRSKASPTGNTPDDGIDGNNNDFGDNLSRGYSNTPADWRNIEVTWYVKATSYSPSDDEITTKGGTNRHTGDHGCQGFSYGVGTGVGSPVTSRFFKETWHVNYDYKNSVNISSSVVDDMIDGNWHGIKYIRYDLDENGTPTTDKNNAESVKLEHWIDGNGDGTGWVKVNETNDNGGWGSGGDDCGGDSDQVGLWGSGHVLYRTDATGGTNLQFKWMSVREIDASIDFDGTNPGPNPTPNPTPNPSGGELDANGIRIPYVMTGNKKAVTFESHHENGDRYSTESWKYENYYAVAYFHTAKKDQVNIEMKTDGPNHGGCDQMPECQWAEPDFQVQTGRSQISSEWPHPTNHPAVSSGFTIVDIPGNYDDQWIGFGVAAYWNSDGYRVYDQWVDVDPFDGAGKPKNGWVRTIHGVNTGQLMPNPKRDLPTDFDQGLELEFRCHHGYGTSMKWGNSYEIDPDAIPSTGGTETFYIVYAIVKGYATYDQYTDTIGHEIVEACTRPDPQGTFGNQAWADYTDESLGEISDFCQDGDTYPSGLWMQGYWSNSDANCVIPGLAGSDLGSSSLVTTRGGRVLPTAKVYLIYWGSDWKTRTAVPTATELTHQVKDLMLGTNVSYFDKLTQYGSVQRPVWGGVVFNTTTAVPSGSELTKAQIEAFVKDTLNLNLVPRPTTDVNSIIYHVVAPVGKLVVSGDSTVGGFHNIFRPVLTSIPPVETCPEGQHEENGLCVPDEAVPPGGCPSGQHEENGVCVPNTPPPPPPPPIVVTKLSGILKLMRDINVFRTSACSGNSGGGGGGGGGGTPGTLSSFYDAETEVDRELSDHSNQDHRTRIGEQCTSTSDIMHGKIIQQLDVPMKRTSSAPAATPIVNAKIWNKSNNEVYKSPTTVNPATLTTSLVTKIFDFSTNTHAFQTGDYVGVEYKGTNSTKFVYVNYDDHDDQQKVKYIQYENGVLESFGDREFTATMYE